MRKKTDNKSDHVCGRRCSTEELKIRLKVVHSDVTVSIGFGFVANGFVANVCSTRQQWFTGRHVCHEWQWEKAEARPEEKATIVADQGITECG